MFWLKLVAIAVLVTLGILLISYLEEVLVSGPRRRELKRKGKEKLAAGRSGEDPVPKV